MHMGSSAGDKYTRKTLVTSADILELLHWRVFLPEWLVHSLMTRTQMTFLTPDKQRKKKKEKR